MVIYPELDVHVRPLHEPEDAEVDPEEVRQEVQGVPDLSSSRPDSREA